MQSRYWQWKSPSSICPQYLHYRVHTLSQKQICRTFPRLRSIFPIIILIHINPFTPKISMLICLTACRTFHIFFNLSSTDFQNFPGPAAFFQDFPAVENAAIKFPDFPGFPGPIGTLTLKLSLYNSLFTG